VRRLEDTYAGALPVNQLADELGVHRRTVVRWVKALETAWLDDQGDPVVRREHRDGVAYAALTGARRVLTANIFQYAAVFAATQHLEAGGGSVLSEGASDVLDRVEEGLTAGLRGDLPRVLQSFHYVPFAPKDHRANEDTLDALIRALIRRYPLRVAYTNAANQTSTQCLEPWTLVMYRDGFYVLAKSPGDDRLRLYAVERMSEVEIDVDGSFEVPKDYDPRQEFRPNLGVWRSGTSAVRVRIAFDSTAEPALNARRWPGFHRLGPGEDGRLELELDVPLTPEITSWVLSWGPVAEVVEPPELRTRVAEQLSAAARRYDVG
jgi:predicted DNA-binding transcriptional regulator YafY